MFDDLSPEAKQTIIGMVEYCLNHGLCMGMDEGFKTFEPEIKHDFRIELESFVAKNDSAVDYSAPADRSY